MRSRCSARPAHPRIPRVRDGARPAASLWTPASRSSPAAAGGDGGGQTAGPARTGATRSGSHRAPLRAAPNDWVDLGINFRYFFARKTMFVKYSQAFICLAAGSDAGRAVRGAHPGPDAQDHEIPDLLVGTEFWSGLMDWLRSALERSGKISPGDIDLIHVTDSIDEVVRIVVSRSRAWTRPHFWETRTNGERGQDCGTFAVCVYCASGPRRREVPAAGRTRLGAAIGRRRVAAGLRRRERLDDGRGRYCGA